MIIKFYISFPQHQIFLVIRKYYEVLRNLIYLGLIKLCMNAIINTMICHYLLQPLYNRITEPNILYISMLVVNQQFQCQISTTQKFAHSNRQETPSCHRIPRVALHQISPRSMSSISKLTNKLTKVGETVGLDQSIGGFSFDSWLAINLDLVPVACCRGPARSLIRR